jgi:uncharacterized protein (TIGR02145 family)
MRNLKFTAIFFVIFSIIFSACEKDKETQSGYNCDNGTCASVVGNATFATLAACEESCDGGVTGTYRPGTVHCNPNNPTAVVEVLNPVTGKTWMDRNLGASRVATSSTDEQAYGDLYQWGRLADGHQCRTSPTTTQLSSTDVPGHGDFILAPQPPVDWRTPQNDNLWQGVSGVNNPCPAGYRLPTFSELDAEWSSWSSNNAAGAFASPLKLPMAGGRTSIGSLFEVGSLGNYWSSSVSPNTPIILGFSSFEAGIGTAFRGIGLSVRCIKD